MPESVTKLPRTLPETVPAFAQLATVQSALVQIAFGQLAVAQFASAHFASALPASGLLAAVEPAWSHCASAA